MIVDVIAVERDRREPARVAGQRELALNRRQSLVEATSAAVRVREVDGSARRDAPRAAGTRAVAAEPAVLFTHVHRLRTAAGGHRWFRTRAAPVRSGGRVVQWVGTETDIDDAVRARDRLDLQARATLALGTATEPDGELAAPADVLVPEFADGGDRYDAFDLPGGGPAVGVGDVEGHDPPAAATMGRLRSMLRALADGAHSPSAAVAALHRVATRLGVAPRADGGAVFRWSDTGHPQPVLVPADGEPAFLSGDVGIVLGVAPDAPRGDSEVVVPPGATLLLHTDGVVDTDLLALVRDTAADTDDDTTADTVALAVRVS